MVVRAGHGRHRRQESETPRVAVGTDRSKISYSTSSLIVDAKS